MRNKKEKEYLKGRKVYLRRNLELVNKVISKNNNTKKIKVLKKKKKDFVKTNKIILHCNCCN